MAYIHRIFQSNKLAGMEKQLGNDEILKMLNKNGYAISSDKQLNNLSHDDAKQIMGYFFNKCMQVPIQELNTFASDAKYQKLMTKPTLGEINLSAFILSQQL